MTERTRLSDCLTAPMPMPPGWRAWQSEPDLVAYRPQPAHFYAAAPYMAYKLGAPLVQTVYALSRRELARLAWEQQHAYEVAMQRTA